MSLLARKICEVVCPIAEILSATLAFERIHELVLRESAYKNAVPDVN